MLKRISDIQGIGLLYQANGTSHTCQKATFIYSDNARGKSTLASILESASIGNASLIIDRKTIDGTLAPKVVLQFDNGHKVSFENSTWSEQRPEIIVFDANFIERNVHSGGTVSTGHRKNLLEFALGESAVAARTELEKATSEAKAAMDQVQSLASKLSEYHIGMTLDQFEKLPAINDIEVKFTDLQKRINAAKDMAMILSKPVPAVVAEPTFDIESVFGKLATSLENIHEDAERVVKEHATTLGNKKAEHWLSQGEQFNISESCPYCGQKTSENNLIRAYRTYFNTAYNNLKTNVMDIHDIVIRDTASSIIDTFSQKIATAIAQANAWIEYIQTSPIKFDSEPIRDALVKLQALMLNLLQKKKESLGESIGTEVEKNEATALWNKIIIPMQIANLSIKAVAETINTYKVALAADDVQQLQQQMQQLQTIKQRYDVNVVEMINRLKVLRTTANTKEKEKKTARENLDTLMKTTLEKYENSINALLKKFGASFTIEGMGANFRGTAPRSEYGLLLRGKNVALDGGAPSFATALSEGAKRTLAFAFFVASTLADSKLATRIVVIDDPMCSLDLNRKQHTKLILKKIHAQAEQLIVLAHDIYFIRDLKDALLKENKTAQIAIFQLAAHSGDYTDFSSLDVDKECESFYFQHHRLLNEFITNNSSDAKSVAKAIRPMLEGYLHRRFPGLIPKDIMFGQVVASIRDAAGSNPLRHAQNLVEELNEINEYAGQFHHDTNANADTVIIIPTELKTYAERALNVVHKSTIE
jgi:wobble nucleotide-excising tRNase